MKKTVFSALVILAVLFSALALPSATLAAGGTCDPSTTGDDDITCTGDTIGDVNADEGDDSITVEEGATVTGDVQGDQGADTILVEEGAIVDGDLQGNVERGAEVEDLADEITNNGTVTGEIFGGAGADIITNSGDVGDDIIGGGGADLINNTGDVEGKIDGYDGDDTIVNSGSTGLIWGSGGDDTITNSGSADLIWGSGGDDTITNSGTTDLIWGNSGDDTITNSGTVTGNIESHRGDDTVILETGVQIDRMIEGAGCEPGASFQTDTLIFNMSTYDAAEYNAAQTVIAGATDESLAYDFAWDGGTISWQYFDTLLDNLSLHFKTVSEKPVAAEKPVVVETATLIVEDDVLKIFQNESGTLRFYAVTPEGDIFVAELKPSAWEYAQAGDVLLNAPSTLLETQLVVTMLESGRLQVEYKSSGGAVLLLTDIAP